MLHLRSARTLPAAAALLRRHAAAAVAPSFHAAAAAAAAPSSGRGPSLWSGLARRSFSSHGGFKHDPDMIPEKREQALELQDAAVPREWQQGPQVSLPADQLPDLYQLPEDEDPAVTAARVLVREDLRKEKQKREIIEHFGIMFTVFALVGAYAVYEYKTNGRMILMNPFTQVLPEVPLTLLPADPAAEDGALWTALRNGMPSLRVVPELEEQWKVARKEKRKQKRREEEEEILFWGGYIKEKPKKEKKKKKAQEDEAAAAAADQTTPAADQSTTPATQ